ncbi:acyl-CoA dehydrogenase [Streptomyces pharetrae]|uniref:acyl-CoA dehydrogenase n=1 Tax=Streptomyces pharetrae TaxID=291370 RepID=UPI0036686B04
MTASPRPQAPHTTATGPPATATPAAGPHATTPAAATPAGAQATTPAAARRRAARLEALLGDPQDPANPHGTAALCAADALGEPPEPTEALLTETGLAAEFVPARSGGLLTRADLLVTALRPLFRRDLALGLGFGLSSLSATAPVWAAGTTRQRQATADLLLRGGRAAAVRHEPAHANALARGELTAAPYRGGWVLDGRKNLIMNASRAGAWVACARTASRRGPHSHSVLLLEPGELPRAQVRRLPRVPTPGLRGTLFSGLQFTHCPVPADALVGRPGEGTALALRTLQIDHCLIPAVAVAAAETVLRSAVHAASSGRSTPVARRWHKPLAGVFADLLTCDSMTTVALRALSLLPERTHLLAAAVRYVVPDLLRENLEELTTVLGTPGHEHAAPHHRFADKLARDLPFASLGHTGTAACHAVIVPQLRSLAEHSWFRAAEPPPELFRTGADLPALDHRLLGIAGGEDVLAASLTGSAGRLAATASTHGHIAVLAGLAKAFTGELRTLRSRCAALPAHPGPAAVILSDRYALLQAAAAVLGIWEAQDGTDAFLTEPAWAVLALSRLARRLGIRAPAPPDGCTAQVLDELLARHRTGRSCDLDAGRPGH